MVICHKIKIWSKPNTTLTMYLLLLNSLFILFIGFNESNGRALDSSKLQKRIISGEDAELFQIPYVAAVTIRKDNAWYAICTGVLVTENKVLTAAHCVEKFTASNFLIFVGVIRFYGPYSGYEQFSYVSKIDVHDGDMGSNPGLPLRDLAVLTLAVPAILSRNVQVVQLSANSALYFNTECTITGWGITKEGTQNIPNYLQKGETTLISTMECETYWPIMREELNAGTIICVLDKYESPSRSTTICNGDSGGPLLCGPNRDVLVGIAVAKISNCDGTWPQFYLDISRFRSWVANKLSS
ncbi:fibrinolytic enzyme, isozyme C [Biomphalaria glabrata]|nr:fibrinolytic enzyme, isozyme C [Biomphalaria glabrata]